VTSEEMSHDCNTKLVAVAGFIFKQLGWAKLLI